MPRWNIILSMQASTCHSTPISLLCHMTQKLELIVDDWRQRGFSCDTWSDPPAQVWSDFVHDADELLMLLEGEIEIQMGGSILHPAIAEEVTIPAGMHHTVINTGATANRWLYGYKID